MMMMVMKIFIMVVGGYVLNGDDNVMFKVK